jgi:hypothetical protein
VNPPLNSIFKTVILFNIFHPKRLWIIVVSWNNFSAILFLTKGAEGWGRHWFGQKLQFA